MRSRGCLGAVALALAAVACEETVTSPTAPPAWSDDGPWWQGGSGGAPGDEGVTDNYALPADLLANVRRILTDHCAPCHSGDRGVAEGGFGYIYDADAMRSPGIVSNDIGTALLYQRVAAGEMPPPGAVDPFDPSRAIGPVSAEDLAILGEWIGRWGAYPIRPQERTPYGGLELRLLMLDDLTRLPPDERSFYRYVSLSFFHDSWDRFPGQTLDLVVNSVSVLLNALSPSRPAVARPVPLLDPAGEPVALRLDLRDYDLDASDWARIEGATEVVDRDAFPCAVPFLQAEQLLAIAARDEYLRADGGVESVYANIVLRRALERAGVLAPGQLVFAPVAPGGAPLAEPLASEVTLPQLAAALGVDLAADIAQGGEGVVRFCDPANAQTVSGFKNGYRCVQRDAMPGEGRGGFWWTMSLPVPDNESGLAPPVGPSNGDLVPEQAGVERFALTSGVAFWPWQNLALGFAAFDDRLRLRSSAVEYPATGAAALGVKAEAAGCMHCHSTGPFPAEISLAWIDVGSRGDLAPAEAGFVDRLFRPQDVIRGHAVGDSRQNFEAAARSCVRGCGHEYAAAEGVYGVFSVGTTYAEDLTARALARSLYLDEDALFDLAALDPELSALMPPSFVGISRAEFTRSFGAFRRAAVIAGFDEGALNFCVVPATQ